MCTKKSFLIFLINNVLSSEDVLLNGSDRTIISFKTNEECGLVHPIPDNIEQEVQLTEHYRLHSSRLKYNDVGYGFTLANPTYNEALTWYCCQISDDSPGKCRSIINKKKIISFLSPVQVSKITQIYHENNVKELAAVVVEASITRPVHLKGDVAKVTNIEIILDVDPASCDVKYTQKFKYLLDSKSKKDRNPVKYFAFSDSNLPKDCKVNLYLQKTCSPNQDDCNIQSNGQKAYSHSGNVEKYPPTNFTTTYTGDNYLEQIVLQNNLKIDGKSLNVLYPNDDKYPLPETISFFIDNGKITAKLPMVGPNYINGYIKGNKAICEARGNPKPELKLKHSTIDIYDYPKIDSCGWDCIRYIWSLSRKTLISGNFTCIAQNDVSKDQVLLPPPIMLERWNSLTPLDQKPSIYGGPNREDGAIFLNASVVIKDWDQIRGLLVERKTKKNYSFKYGIKDYEKLLVDQVTFKKRGSDAFMFGCGRTEKRVFFEPDCLTSNTCEVIIQMIVFLPEKSDEGTYTVEMTTDNSNQISTETTNSVHVSIRTEMTDFVSNITTTVEGEHQYNKFEIDECKAINGEAAKCEWYPMWNQHRFTELYSVHYMKMETCESKLSKNDTVIIFETNLNKRGSAPKKLSAVTRNLTPGAKYRVKVCTWEKSNESKSRATEGRLEADITGFGQRYCRFYDRRVNRNLITAVAHLKMPLQVPKYFPTQPIISIPSPFSVKMFYKPKVFEQINEIGGDGFDAIYRMLSTSGIDDKFTECDNCPYLRFVASSTGSTINWLSLPPGIRMRFFFRYTNQLGKGPYDDSMRSLQKRYKEVTVPEDDSITSNEIYMSNVKRSDTSISFNVPQKFIKNDQFEFVINRDGDLSTMNSIDKCSKLKEVFQCAIQITENTQRLLLSTENHFPISSIFLNDNIEEMNIPGPLLTLVNRTMLTLTIRFIPKTVLVLSEFPETSAFIVYLKYEDLRSPTSINQNYTFESDGSDVYEFKYFLQKCVLMNGKNRFNLIKDENGDCYPFSDLKISVRQQIGNRLSDESLVPLINPTDPSYLSSNSMQKHIDEYPIPDVVLSALPNEPSRVIVDVANIQSAVTNEMHIHVQVIQKPLDHDCSSPEAWKMAQEHGQNIGKIEILDESHTRYGLLTNEWLIPRKNYDLYSHSTDESFTQLMLDTKKYTFMDMQSDTAHIKQLGGFDGCTMPESECSQQVDSARLEPNGYISLPDNPKDDYSHKNCQYCFRARLKFQDPKTPDKSKCSVRGCFGGWSSGKEFKNPEGTQCSWDSTYPGPHPSKTIQATTDAPSTPNTPVPSSIIERTPTSGILIGALAIAGVILLLIIILTMKMFLIRNTQNQNDGYTYGRPGNPPKENSMCSVPINRQDMELPHRASSPKEVTLCGPGLDSSICSQNRPESSHYSSFDSGIDRNSGSFRSGTDWFNN